MRTSFALGALLACAASALAMPAATNNCGVDKYSWLCGRAPMPMPTPAPAPVPAPAPLRGKCITETPGYQLFVWFPLCSVEQS
jgi:hypothetical protein